MNTHLVIGASGLVGEHLMRAVESAGFAAAGTYRSHAVPGMLSLDIRDRRALREVLEETRPSVVYLPASMANVEACERNPGEFYTTNVEGVRNVLDALDGSETRLVYFSSDYVFDGKAGPYGEDDPPNPVCVYGTQKVIAELLVALRRSNHLIIRTTVVYGWERQGKNFIYRLLETLRRGDSLRVPVDQVGSPTYAPNLARAVVELATSGARGLYHVVGPERADRYTFALAAASALGLDTSLIVPVATHELGQTAPRPLDAGMRVDKASATLSFPLLDFRTGLALLASEGPFRS